MILADIVVKTPNELVCKTLHIQDYDYPEGSDFYESVAYKLGWDGDGDALWFISKKNVILVERGEPCMTSLSA